MNQPQLGNFESIALTAIRPSPTNPRKHFNQLQLEELARSIGEMGVTNPLLLRPWPTSVKLDPPSAYVQFEIVAGERRYRAAEIAGAAAVPAIVRNLSDTEVLNIQLVENLQRSDLHPMEEAEGYRVLVVGGATAEDIAKRTGKSLAYVKQRIQLLALEQHAKALYEAEHLTLDHALMLARLTASDQARAVTKMLSAEHMGSKLDLVAHTKAKIAEHARQKRGYRLISMTPAELKIWIASNVFLQLKGVPWDIGDAELLPLVGACTNCPKRSGANSALFQDLTTAEDTCADPTCFNDKQKAFVKLTQLQAKEAGTPFLKISSKRSCDKLSEPAVVQDNGGTKVLAKAAIRDGQWVEAKRGECPSTVKGLFTDGDKMGKTKFVCPDQACKVHKHRVEEPRPKPASVPGESYEQREQRQRKEREGREAIEKKVREAIAAEIGPKSHEGSARFLEMFIFAMISESGDVLSACKLLEIDLKKVRGNKWEMAHKAEPLLEKYLLEEATLQDLRDVAFGYFLQEAIEVRDHNDPIEDREKMWALAKRVGVDADAIAKRIEDEDKAAKLAAAKNILAKPTKKAAKKAAAKRAKGNSGVDGKSAAAGALQEANA